MAYTINRDELIYQLRKLIAYESVNPPGKEDEISTYISNFLKENGIEAKKYPISAESNRTSVVGRLKGRGESPPIIFTGHMDVVPVSASERKLWNTDPFVATIIDNHIYGRGSTDMKSGLAAAMVALASISRNNLVPSGDIILVATADEEDIMRGSKSLIKTDVLKDAKYIVVCEPSEMNLHYCCKGRTWAKIEVHGKTAHASIENAGQNAIHSATKLIDHILTHEIPKNTHPLLGSTFWQITEIHGGIEPAIVPDNCSITVDARISPGQTSEDIWTHMEDCLASFTAKHKDTKTSIKIIERREPWVTELESPIIKATEKALRKVGLPVNYNGFPGTTDASVLSKIGAECIILGPGSMHKAHKENENVSIQEYLDAAEVYYNVMLDGWNF